MIKYLTKLACSSFLVARTEKHSSYNFTLQCRIPNDISFHRVLQYFNVYAFISLVHWLPLFIICSCLWCFSWELTLAPWFDTYVCEYEYMGSFSIICNTLPSWVTWAFHKHTECFMTLPGPLSFSIYLAEAEELLNPSYASVLYKETLFFCTSLSGPTSTENKVRLFYSYVGASDNR